MGGRSSGVATSHPVASGHRTGYLTKDTVGSHQRNKGTKWHFSEFHESPKSGLGLPLLPLKINPSPTAKKVKQTSESVLVQKKRSDNSTSTFRETVGQKTCVPSLQRVPVAPSSTKMSVRSHTLQNYVIKSVY